ncbi:energy transducer TonB [Ekhidna sp.]
MKYLLLLSLAILSCTENDLRVSKASSEGNSEIVKTTLIGCRVEIIAQFPGGNDKLNQFVATTLKRNSEKFIQGRVFVSFVVDQQGAIKEPVILRGIDACKSCNEAALRMVGEMPNWIPANIQGTPMRQKLVMPIKFGIDK